MQKFLENSLPHNRKNTYINKVSVKVMFKLLLRLFTAYVSKYDYITSDTTSNPLNAAGGFRDYFISAEAHQQ